jgi:hypothetical protein
MTPQDYGLGYDTRTRWPSYFAWRLAPLGAVGPPDLADLADRIRGFFSHLYSRDRS